MRPFLFLLVGSVVSLGACSSKNDVDGNPGSPDAQSDAAPSIDAGSLDDGQAKADRLRQELERRLDEAVAAGFSGSVLVTVGGRRVLARGYGVADRAKQVPNAVDTAFDVGSIMKDVTAAAIFKLAGAGKLAITDPLETFFDGVPADKAKITVLQLLLHRAGLDEYHDTDGDFEPMTRLEARKRILAQTLRFAPGSKEAYSNSGYTLLADIVESRSGRAYTNYVRDELFVPAQMKQSGFFGDPLWQQVDTAIGYDASTFEGNDPSEWPYTWALVGNGGLVTTVSDLERWVTALWAGAVLDQGAFDAYRTKYLASGAHDVEGKTVYGMAGGGDYGFGGVVLDCPDAGTRVIIATNTAGRFDIETFGTELGKLVLRSE